MKRLLTLTCCALLCAYGVVSAQTGGKIALSATVDGANCGIVDAGGITDVHVVVFDVKNFDGIQFAAPKPDCWEGATYLEEESHGLLFIGDTQDTDLGLSIVWGSCGSGGLNGSIHVATIRYQTMGTAPPCCEYPILKAKGDLHPEIPGPIIVMCDPLRLAGVTVSAVINPGPQCPCASPTPVETTTWSGIKAMYTD